MVVFAQYWSLSIAFLVGETLLLSGSICAFVAPIDRPCAASRHHAIAGASKSGISAATDGRSFLSSPRRNSGERSTSLRVTSDANASAAEISKAPILNGKMVLPMKAMAAGLKGHKVAAVYAIINSSYKRGAGEGWVFCEHVSITRDLAADLSHFASERGPDAVAHVRALSFAYPQKSAMEEFANGWRSNVDEAGGAGGGVFPTWGAVHAPAENSASGVDAAIEAAAARGNLVDELDYDDDDDDMDEDDLDDLMQMMSETRGAGLMEAQGVENFVDDADTVVSPFKDDADAAEPDDLIFTNDEGEPLELNSENVDKVLNEVRPYLISDGGNVSVQKVDADTGNVYLVLEGACGSCPSSTVTMKMGIERVLKENFDRLGEVIQVDPEELEGEGNPKELTIQAVQAEVKRISTAIVAMGGVVRVVGVDPIGVVEIEFRGPNKVRQGLELALLDMEFVKHIKFVSGDDK